MSDEIPTTVQERQRAQEYTLSVFGFCDDDDDVPISADQITGHIGALLAQERARYTQPDAATLGRLIAEWLCRESAGDWGEVIDAGPAKAEESPAEMEMVNSNICSATGYVSVRFRVPRKERAL